MRRKALPTALLVLTLSCSSALAVNRVYNGAGIDPNDWTDNANWGGNPPPVAGDNGLFTGPGMTMSQSVAPFDQLQVGRNNNNTLILSAGGLIENLNQTVVGIAGGRGTLLVEGGTLTTVHLRLGLDAGAVSPPGSSVEISSGVIDVNQTPTLTKGNIELGFHRSADFTLSGGAVSTETDFDFFRGSLNVSGSAGSLNVGGSFDFGTGAGPTTLRYALNNSGGASTVFADGFTRAGTNTLSIDGSASTFGTAVNLTLIGLTTDTFSAGELSALQSALVLTEVNGTLSLANGDQDLVFTGTVIPEPSTFGLFAMVLGGLITLHRRIRR